MFGKNPKFLPFIKFIEDHCKELEKGILSQDDTIALKLLYEYLYIINTVYKNIGLLSLISKENGELVQANNSVELIQENFFANKKVYEKLIKIKKVSEKILKKFTLKQNPAIDEILLNIKMLEHKIYSNLLTTNIIPVSKNMKRDIKDLPSSIELNRQNYYFFQRNIHNAREREIIEHFYISHSNKSLNDLANLIIERNKLAVLSGSPTYFNFIKKKSLNENTIKSDIEDLIIKIDQKSRKEVDRIYRNLRTDRFDKKVDFNDIVYYCEKFKTHVEFSPSHVVQCLLTILEKYFGIQFIKLPPNPELWSENVIGYKVGVEKELFGYCYIDLEKNNEKTMTSPVCIHLCHQYTNLENKTTPTKVAIIGNYTNMNLKCMSLSDVIYLFREFGCAVQMLSHKASNGILLANEEFDILMPQLMECILWERTTIELLCKNETIPDIIDNVLFTRHLNFAHSIKIKCVNALFDHVLHNSPELIKIIRSVNQSEYGQVLLSAYKKIYENIMFSQQDILNTNIIGINPTVLQQEINGSEGLIYCNIYTEILSFSIFQLAKTGNGNKFIREVLRCDQNKMKKQLEDFIASSGDNSYDVYLKELIGYNEIDTEINNAINNKIDSENNKYHNIKKHVKILPTIIESSANQYDDSDHSDDNIENIIRIDRKPT
jgi:hypothetical protein